MCMPMAGKFICRNQAQCKGVYPTTTLIAVRLSKWALQGPICGMLQVSAGGLPALSSPDSWWLYPEIRPAQVQPAAREITVLSVGAEAPQILSIGSASDQPWAQAPAESLVSLRISNVNDPAAVDIRLADFSTTGSAAGQARPCRLSGTPGSSSSKNQKLQAMLPFCDPEGQPGAQPPSLQHFQQLPSCQAQPGTSSSTYLQCQLTSQLAAGRYRVMAWSAADGFLLGMPRLDVLPVVTDVTPQTGQCCCGTNFVRADL